MRDYPFDIEKIELDKDELKNQESAPSHIVSYLVSSNAPISVETNSSGDKYAQGSEDKSTPKETYEIIQEIAQFLIAQPKETEIVIHIHGYNTGKMILKNGQKKFISIFSRINLLVKKQLSLLAIAGLQNQLL